jgi:hypothetical protein|tara:strand:- start:235 stop:1749 length:1515 start_codon:yes stop_codon:yes gene_type:complete
MNAIRTYFNKDTVIIRNSCVNTGLNPITELYHGGSTDVNKLNYSRYIFNVDLSSLITKVNNKELFVDRIKHKINLTNTSCFDKELFCKTVSSSCGEVKRATSFDLSLFEVPEIWDEGAGYDYVKSRPVTCDLGDKAYCEGPADWNERQTLTNWSQKGVYTDPTMWYSGSTTGYTGSTINLIKGTQHFDHGDENLCIDITDYINSFLTGGTTGTSVNLGVAFEYSQETAPQLSTCYVGFFAKETQTVYEPFLETSYDDTIKDDRDDFIINKSNNLCLYVNAGGQRTNASISGVTIYDHEDNVYEQIPPSGITQVSTGVYCVSVDVPKTTNYCGNIQFSDLWSGVTVNGNNLGNIELDFIVKEQGDYYSIGSNTSAGAFGLGVGSSSNLSIYDYEFAFTGIQRREKIKRGDTRFINVIARIPFTYDQSQALDGVYYRIYIKEGETEIPYIDWNEVSRTPDGNFFTVDTSWFIPNDYYIEFKITSGNQIRTYEDIIPFTIVSVKDWC